MADGVEPHQARELNARAHGVMGLVSWAQKIQAIAQTGLTYASDPYDRERYEQLQALAHEMLAEATGSRPEDIRELFALEKGYPTPKVDVRAVVFRDGALLLVQEKSTGGWTLPGGWADIGDSASEVAARETREEAGLEVRPEKLRADRRRGAGQPRDVGRRVLPARRAAAARHRTRHRRADRPHVRPSRTAGTSDRLRLMACNGSLATGAHAAKPPRSGRSLAVHSRRLDCQLSTTF
jgi:hypothetical protein